LFSGSNILETGVESLMDDEDEEERGRKEINSTRSNSFLKKIFKY
jgi:hypothetical protein